MDEHPFLTSDGQWLAPYMPRDHLIALAWLDFVRFALSQPACLEAFREVTGCAWYPGQTPLERMIDDATGAEHAFLAQFLTWLNTEHWGPVG